MRPRLVLVLPLVVAGCGTTSVDTDKGEAFITKAITEQVGARVKSVKCPENVTAKKGDRFTCDVTGADGSTGDAVVTQQDDKGSVTVRTPFIPTRQIETSISQQLGVRAAAIDCPEIIPVQKGERFTCQSRSGKRITLVQRDNRGRTQIVR